ncbi:unnamed protein product [Acanthosepion pharaonis]|uniref:Uncharacterized protein n=1 Tax=Acanthosepion pharaonis TaxID=158019 RepID=A0A812DEF2_ACAPH|nr:unnamed protein product [Sepia pharaonis]
MAFAFFLSAVTLRGLSWLSLLLPLCRDPSGRGLSWLSTSSSLSAVTLQATLFFPSRLSGFITCGLSGFPLLLPLCRDPSQPGYHGFHFFFLSAVTLQGWVGYLCRDPLGYPSFFLSAVTLQEVGYHGFHFFFLSAVTLQGWAIMAPFFFLSVDPSWAIILSLLLPLVTLRYHGFHFFFLSAVTLRTSSSSLQDVGYHGFHFFFLSAVTLQDGSLLLPLCRDPSSGWAIMAFHFFFLSAVTLQDLSFFFLCRDPSWAIMAFHFFFPSAVTLGGGGYHGFFFFFLSAVTLQDLSLLLPLSAVTLQGGLSWLSLLLPLPDVGYRFPLLPLCRDPSLVIMAFPLLLPLCRDPSWAIMAFHFFFLSAVTLQYDVGYHGFHFFFLSAVTLSGRGFHFPLCRTLLDVGYHSFPLLLPLCRRGGYHGFPFFFLSAVTLPGRGLSWLSLLLPSAVTLGLSWLSFFFLSAVTLQEAIMISFFFLSAVTLQDRGLSWLSSSSLCRDPRGLSAFQFFFLSAVTPSGRPHGFPFFFLCGTLITWLSTTSFLTLLWAIMAFTSSSSLQTWASWLLLPLYRDPSGGGWAFTSSSSLLSAVTLQAIMAFHFFFPLYPSGRSAVGLWAPLLLLSAVTLPGRWAIMAHFFFLSAVTLQDVGYHGFPFFFSLPDPCQGYHGFHFFFSLPTALGYQAFHFFFPLCRDPSAIMAFNFFFLG